MLNTKGASEYLNVAMGTLSNSRSSGTLLGVDAPKHIKHGSKVLYECNELDKWLAELKDNTMLNPMAHYVNRSKEKAMKQRIARLMAHYVNRSKVSFNDVEWLYDNDQRVTMNDHAFALVVAKREKTDIDGTIKMRVFKPFLCDYVDGVTWNELGEDWKPVKFMILNDNFLMSGVDIMEGVGDENSNIIKLLKDKLDTLKASSLKLDLDSRPDLKKMINEMEDKVKELINVNK